ncbi:hypothetical protein M5K25_003786 [Dendrobium thyrsiflorum]|uniref:Uncharacterized protein n=1 Tax=Dendrobium thyrsiflorum TaxID=117978 RepID=A0ABD0VKF5_DENTH
MKKKSQKPPEIGARKESLPSITIVKNERRQATHGEYRGMTPKPRVQGSTSPGERVKEIWKPKPCNEEAMERRIYLGMTYGTTSQRSTLANKVIRNGSQIEIEELLVSNHEPEIQWRCRSEIRIQEDKEIMDVEVVYMVEQDDDVDDDEDDGPLPRLKRIHQHHFEVGSIASRSGYSSEERGEELEENPFVIDIVTLADMQRQMKQQIQANDKKISQLNNKMIEMMAQMVAIMHRTAVADPISALPINHASNIASINLSNLQMPQVSRVQGTPEGGHEVNNLIRQLTPQNMASTSEPVTVAQLEGIISEKIKAIIATDHAKKLICKGFPDLAEYGQVPYPKGYSILKFNIFSSNSNPKQHLTKFKASYGNIECNDALFFR